MLRYLILPSLFLGMFLLGGLIVSQEQAPHTPPHLVVSLNDIFR